MRSFILTATLAMLFPSAALAEGNPLVLLLAKGSDRCQVVRHTSGDNGPKMVEVVCKSEADFKAFTSGISGIVSYGAGKNSQGFVYQIEQSKG